MSVGAGAFQAEDGIRDHCVTGVQTCALPISHTAQVVDDLSVIRTVYTEAINHDPASTYILTGNQIPGKPSIGAWLSYGLGSEAENLPAFVVDRKTSCRERV